MKIVAIHQPNFFPWLGYFDKIHRADIFILLDDAQYPKTGGNWSNRVKILINERGSWLTAPVYRRFQGTRKINEMVFSNKENWRDKILRTLVFSYKRAYFFEETYSFIEPLIQNQEDNVAVYNSLAIRTLSDALGFPSDKVRHSSDFPVESLATQRLIDLTKFVGGSTYLCGGGAGSYQEDHIFEAANIGLLYQNFAHPSYPQYHCKNFTSGLSIIDALMNLGIDRVRQLIKKSNE